MLNIFFELNFRTRKLHLREFRLYYYFKKNNMSKSLQTIIVTVFSWHIELLENLFYIASASLEFYFSWSYIKEPEFGNVLS